MPSPLQTLLDLRRNAEEGARQALDLAASLRRKEEEEQERLMARWQEARDKATREEGRLAIGPSPTTAAQAAARGHYLVRLRDEAARLAGLAEEHRRGGLAMALAAESAAQAASEEARKSREAIEKLEQRADAEDRRRAERRADESASDLAQAAHVRRGTE